MHIQSEYFGMGVMAKGVLAVWLNRWNGTPLLVLACDEYKYDFVKSVCTRAGFREEMLLISINRTGSY